MPYRLCFAALHNMKKEFLDQSDLSIGCLHTYLTKRQRFFHSLVVVGGVGVFEGLYLILGHSIGKGKPYPFLLLPYLTE